MANASMTAGLPTGVMPVELQRISLEVYRQMNGLGLIDPADRVELLDGFLVKKMPGNPRHASVTRRLARLFEARLPGGWLALKEDTIELPGYPEGDSSPIPDVSIVAGTLDDYDLRHPGPGDIALVVEVASNARMLARDRAGLARYAWAGLPAAWIVDLAGETVEIYSRPSGRVVQPRYGSCEVRRVGDVAGASFGGVLVEVPVDDILR